MVFTLLYRHSSHCTRRGDWSGWQTHTCEHKIILSTSLSVLIGKVVGLNSRHCSQSLASINMNGLPRVHLLMPRLHWASRDYKMSPLNSNEVGRTCSANRTNLVSSSSSLQRRKKRREEKLAKTPMACMIGGISRRCRTKTPPNEKKKKKKEWTT